MAKPQIQIQADLLHAEDIVMGRKVLHGETQCPAHGGLDSQTSRSLCVQFLKIDKRNVRFVDPKLLKPSYGSYHSMTFSLY
jgi:hypothetical protein